MEKATTKQKTKKKRVISTMKHEEVMRVHPEIASWLMNRPFNTQRAFANKLMVFSEAINMTPEQWRLLDKFKARNLLWQYVQPLIEAHPVTAKQFIIVLKSWYRNLNGEQLPFDSGKGGKHAIRMKPQRAIYEHIPNKAEVYKIVDMAGNLRDRAVLLTLFQAGIRVNALTHLKYGDISDQLGKDIIQLRITSEIDNKLRGANIPFYYTFINGEGTIALREYCQVAHKDSKAETPLFYTKTGKAITQFWVWNIVKKCVRRAGFDPKTIWVHSLRKSFRKIVRQCDIDDDTKEEMMGHALRGSREAYFDRNDLELIQQSYQKCNFAREVPNSEVEKLRKQVSELQTLRDELEELRSLVKTQLTKKQGN